MYFRSLTDILDVSVEIHSIDIVPPRWLNRTEDPEMIWLLPVQMQLEIARCNMIVFALADDDASVFGNMIVCTVQM